MKAHIYTPSRVCMLSKRNYFTKLCVLLSDVINLASMIVKDKV